MKREIFSSLLRYSTLILLLFLFFSCSNNRTKEVTTNKAQLTYSGDISFPIDSTTSVLSHSGQLYLASETKGNIEAGQRYFCYLNRGKIQFYHFEDKRLVHTIRFTYDGENAIASSVEHFNILSLDSIYINTFPQPFVYRVNHLGEVKERFQLGGNQKPTETMVSTSNPIIVEDDNLFLGFYTNLPPQDRLSPLTNQELQGIVLQYNMSSREQSLQYYFPKAYTTSTLWSHYYYIAFIQKGASKHDLLISLGADDSITVTNFIDKEKRYYAGSNLFRKINGIPRKKSQWDHYRLNYMYEGILYDPYRKCYYRFLSLPKTPEQIKSPELKKGRAKDMAIITLDENFNKISETILPPDYSHLIYFISEEGLYIYNIQKVTEDENNISFGLFKLDRL